MKKHVTFVLCVAVLAGLTQAALAAWSSSAPPAWGQPQQGQFKGAVPRQEWERRALVESIMRQLMKQFGGEFPYIRTAGNPMIWSASVNGPGGGFEATAYLHEFVDPQAPYRGWYTQFQGYGFSRGTGFYYWGVDAPGSQLQVNVSLWNQVQTGQPGFVPWATQNGPIQPLGTGMIPGFNGNWRQNPDGTWVFVVDDVPIPLDQTPPSPPPFPN